MAESYKIGAKGPGGGIIFYASGGVYKECSGELGEGDWSNAKEMAKEFQGGGFTNWRLPNKGELNDIYENLSKKGLSEFDNSVQNGYYWSSSEGEAIIDGTYKTAWRQNLKDGDQNIATQEGLSYRVRAIRAF